MKQPFIIAIDGPSGAGKSTLGRLLARELGQIYIDTGAMYRVVALAVLEAGVSPTDAAAVTAVAKDVSIEVEGDPDLLRVMLNKRDVSEEIRREEVSRVASMISIIPAVRRELVRAQREMSRRGSVVLDGRDIGTIVFPNADVKFFLTATPEQRAQRRHEQERLRGQQSSYDETLHDINERDQRDSTRDDSPLAIAEDAVVIDSTELSVEDVFKRMVSIARNRQAPTTGEA